MKPSPLFVLQMNKDGVVLDRHILERSTLVEHILETVIPVECRIGQTFTNGLLLGGMDLAEFIRINQIVDAYQTAVGNDLRCFPLLFAQ